jgi:hypothetical protein
MLSNRVRPADSEPSVDLTVQKLLHYKFRLIIGTADGKQEEPA